MKTVKTGRKILLLIILLSPLAIYLESCKKVDTSRTPNTLPNLTTTTLSAITATSAITGGNITSDGGPPILSRGVVWSTSLNPTIALSTKTKDGTGTGNFTSNLTGLSPDRLYFVRAYATTSLGTAYGNEVSFKFSTSDDVIVREHEIIFKNLVWGFPWYPTLEVKNISTYIPTGTPIKVFVQRDNASEWKEASPDDNNANVYEYFIETRPNGNGLWTSYGSFYVFYFGRDTDDTPDVKIQF